MKNKTHNNITRRILPGLDPKIIEQINRMIDNPEPGMPTFSPELGGMPGLDYRGHRIKGHDLVSVTILGLILGGPKGLAAALIHPALDSARDQVVKKYGSNVADVLESIFNLGYELYPKTSKRRKSHAKPKK